MSRAEDLWYKILWICLLLLAAHGQNQKDPSSSIEGCPPNYESLSSHCVKLGGPSSWQTYVDDCLSSGGNVTLRQLHRDDGRQLLDLLVGRNVSAVWDDTRRHGHLGPYRHQLPANDMYFRLVYDDLRFTAMQGELECLVGTWSLLAAVGTLEIMAEDCDELRRYVCVIARGQVPLKPNYTPESRPPKLRLKERQFITSTQIILEVYNPESLWGWEDVPPVCVMDSANVTMDGIVNITRNTLGRNLTWTLPGDVSGRELITKAEYLVQPPGDGYIICWAYTHDQSSLQRISSNHFLHRKGDYYYTIYVNVTDDETGSNSFLNTFKMKTNQLNEALTYGDFSGFSVEITPLGFVKKKGHEDERLTTINSLWSTFRVSLTSTANTSQQPDTTVDAIFRAQIAKLLEKQRNGFDNTGDTLSSSYCEAFETVDGNNSTITLSWPATRLGDVAFPLVGCRGVACDNTCGNILAKQCEGNFAHGAAWGDSLKVPACIQPSTRVQHLQNYSMNAVAVGLNITLGKVEAEIKGGEPLSAVEVTVIANILATNTSDNLTQSDIMTLANIINKISEGNGSRIAQRATYSSKTILESVDRLLNNVDLTNDSSLTVTPRYTTLVADVPPASGIAEGNSLRGILVRRKTEGHGKSFEEMDVKLLTSGDSLQAVLERDVDIAVLLPPRLYTDSSDPVRLVLQLFHDDALFDAKLPLGRTVQHVVSVSLDGETNLDNLEPPVYVLFDNYGRQDRNATCVFWDLAANNWSDVGCALGHCNTSTSTDVCVCTHLTHFAQLIYEEENPNIVLDLISAVGCVFSLIGLACIGITGAVFTDWRKNTGHKVQLHLSAAIALLMSLFLVDSLIPEQTKNDVLCKTKGVLLHYAVLASFCWMLIVAVLQYLRLVVVWATFSRTPYLVTKASLFGWGVPLIPCTTLLVIDSDTYGLPRCYLSGEALIYGAYVPVSIFVFVNCSIFGIILHQILRTANMQTSQDSQRRATQGLVTSLFLFLLFGLSWIFALAKLPELFCIIASLQGVSFFLFFIVLDRETSQRWRNLLMKKKFVRKYTISSITIREEKRTREGYHDTQPFSRSMSNPTSETSFTN